MQKTVRRPTTPIQLLTLCILYSSNDKLLTHTLKPKHKSLSHFLWMSNEKGRRSSPFSIVRHYAVCTQYYSLFSQDWVLSSCTYDLKWYPTAMVRLRSARKFWRGELKKPCLFSFFTSRPTTSKPSLGFWAWTLQPQWDLLSGWQKLADQIPVPAGHVVQNHYISRCNINIGACPLTL